MKLNVLNKFAKTSKGMSARKLNYKIKGTEVAFAHIRDLSRVWCYHYGKKGHYTKTCPEKEVNKGQVHTHISKTFMKEKMKIIKMMN